MENNCKCESKIISVSNKDLQVFRGTYEEVMKQPTVNMKVYLAWDTQQIFVGNSHGIKTPYNGQYKAVIQNYITNLRSELYESIDDRVQKELDETLADIETRVNENLTKTFEGTISDLVKQNTNEYDKRITANEQVVASLDIQASSLRNRVTNNENSISSLQTSVDSLQSASNLAYRTGQEISQLALNVSTFKPVFCTQTYGNYKIGRIYYADGNEIKAMAGGTGSSKATIDAGLSLSLNPTTTYIPMSSQSTTYRITPSVSTPSIVSSYTLNLNGDRTEYNTLSSLTETAHTVSVNRSTEQTIKFELTATTIKDSDDYEYTANTASKSIVIYKPWFFGNISSLVEYKPTDTKFSASITSGSNVYLYASKSGLEFASNGFSVPYDACTEAVLTFNGLNASFYRYAFNGINDTTMAIEIK